MDLRPHPIKPPIERFLALVKIQPGCWLWLGSTAKNGYGQFVLDGRRDRKKVRIAPYKFIWEYLNGPMPKDLEPDHTCNNRRCCNPEHIEPVTHAENQRRAAVRRRLEGRRVNYTPRSRPTHCPHGHEYTPANSYLTPQGSIYCRECNRLACSARNAKRKQSSSANTTVSAL